MVKYKVGIYRRCIPQIKWYHELGRNESLGKQLAQISFMCGGVPLLPLAFIYKEMYPSKEIEEIIKGLTDFYQAEVEE